MCARIFCQPAVTTGIVTMCRRIVTESLSTEPVDNFVNNFGTKRCNALYQAGTLILDNCYTSEQMTINQRVKAPMRKSTNQKRLNSLFQDRKSTRLNSSHVAISYAVFCLKKKTPRQAQAHPSTRHH